MDEKECLTVSGYQQSEHESELDGLETVVRNVIPILNSPILALLAVPVSHLKEEKKKITISKEKTINNNALQFNDLLSKTIDIEGTDEITNIKKRNSKESCRSTNTTETNDYKRGNISDNAEHSDLATITENKEEQDWVVKYEEEVEKEEDTNSSEILSEAEEIESITSVCTEDNDELQKEKQEVENVLYKAGNKATQRCNVM